VLKTGRPASKTRQLNSEKAYLTAKQDHEMLLQFLAWYNCFGTQPGLLS
jgi:hypothetical protein